MNSRITNSLVATGVALALGSTAALAANPLANGLPTGTITIYSAGGSAQTNAAFAAAWNLLNVQASYTQSATGAADGSYRVLFGTLKNAYTANGVTVAAATPVLYFYKFNGGSFPNGAEPQAGSGVTLNYTTIASLVAAVATGNALPAANYSYTLAATNAQVPDWGLTDEEVPLFNFPFNLPYANGTTFISGTHPQEAPVTVGRSDAIYDDVFGVAVTANLYANKTNFTKEEINGIWSGTLTDWSQINGDNGAPLAAGGIVLLDRNQGSGTKAAGSVYFLNYPTGIATGSYTAPASISYPSTYSRYTTTGNPVGTYEDIIDSSSGNLVSDLVAAQAAGDRAIGIVSAETAPISSQVSGANTWDFVAINNEVVDSVGNINGSTSNYSNVIRGGYDFFYQNSFNTRATFLSTATANAALANAWKAEFNAPAFAGVVSHVAFPAAVNGILLDAASNSYGAGVTTGSRSEVSESPLAVTYDATNPITATINANADPL